MKIFVRGGHNSQAIGAKALIDEYTEDRKVTSSVVKYLNQLGHTAKDGSPGAMDSSSDLVYGVNQAVNFGAELFVSIHFNKAYSSYEGAIGSEALVHSSNLNSIDGIIAKRIVANLGEAGFKNRGIKHNDSLYEMRINKQKGIPAIIIEVCFVEATKDVELYKKLGSDYIGKIIAEAIANKSISSSSSSSSSSSNSTSELYRIRKSWSDSSSQIGAYSILDNAISECKKAGSSYKVFDSKGLQIYPTTSTSNSILKTNYKETGKGRVICSKVNVRDFYDINNSNIVASYSRGETFYYNEVYITNDSRVWVSYISNSGFKRYVCVKDSDGTRLVNCT